MSSQKRKLAALFLWGGALLVVVGIVLSYSRLVPFVETLLYSQEIPTAPPLLISTQSTVEALLPSGAGEEISDTPAPVETEGSAVTQAGDLSESDALTAESPVTSEPVVTPMSSPVPQPTPSVPPTLAPSGTLPQGVKIPDIDLDAPVVSIGWKLETINGQTQAIWDVPDWRAAGWHDTSALLGVAGNTVFNGHNTSKGEVFRDLYKLEVGARIFVVGEDGDTYPYRVGEKYILREAGQPLSVRLDNARYIQETPDERLTLVTCHPYGSLANRLIVIAYPVPPGEARERME